MNTLERVRRITVQEKLLSAGEVVVVGVSGGPDSLALLHMLRELAPSIGFTLHIAHLDHRLRGEESDADAVFVDRLAADWNLPLTIEALSVSDYAHEHHFSIEEAARILRYRFLRDVAVQNSSKIVAVGHNADDQVETFVMHLLRGSGLAGLRGMLYRAPMPVVDQDPHQPNVELVRPLLRLTRKEIEAYCKQNALVPRIDSTNSQRTVFRNRLRHEVIPYLETINPNLRAVLHHTALILGEDYAFLQSHIESAIEDVAREADGVWVFDLAKWQDLPPALQRGSLREAVRRLRRGLRDISWTQIDQARQVALDKHVGSEATLPQNLLLVMGYEEFTIGETHPLPDVPLLHTAPLTLNVGSITELPDSAWLVRAVESHGPLTASRPVGKWRAVIDADKVRGRLVLRVRKPGERFVPQGMEGHTKSLNEYMIDEKIPHQIRGQWPLLADHEKLVWVCGHRVDERSKANDETRRILEIEFLKGSEATESSAPS